MLPGLLPFLENPGGTMATYEFLSPEWIEAVKALRDDLPDTASGVAVEVTLNLVVNETPWGTPVDAHVDTTQGPLIVSEGHLETADLHVTVDYATARALLVDGNPQAAMTAFMAGKIQVDGDLAKLMVLQGSSPEPSAIEFAEKMRALTS